ncbi:MAG: hypothetical protein CO167_04105 [Candidatus Marinimicrobia bacterium CG_4_9_14_3_um_filter_48_9]|nr:MAG: hypothetical protein CO167_04105 [Candidatus Marinimicrobia bacterium CG_4_9_14_3_um_filter_48_9]
MRELKIFLVLVIVLAAVWLLTQNSTPVDVKLFNISYLQKPLYLIILVTFTIGALLGFAYGISQTYKLKSDIRVLNKERLKLQTEVDQRRVAMLDREDQSELTEKPKKA